MDIEKLSEFIEERWQFEESNYPPLVGMDEEEKKRFIARHILMHLQKELGKLARVCEPVDHGKPFDTSQFPEILRDLIIESLRLSKVVGVSTADIIASINTLYS